MLENVLILCLLLLALFNKLSPCYFSHCTDGINKTDPAPTSQNQSMRKKENRWMKKEWGVQGSSENYFG